MPNAQGRARIKVFGPVRAWTAEGAEVSGLTRPARALAALLALSERPLDRREAASLIWPQAEPSRAQVSLRNALSQLRRIHDEAIAASGAGLALNPGAVSWDVGDARRLSRLAALKPPGAEQLALLRQAVEAAEQPLAADLEQEWLEPHRAEWRRFRRDAALRLAEAARSEPESEEALHWAQTALRLDPLDERSLSLNLQLLAERGERERAMRLGRDLARLWREELGQPLPRPIIDLLAEIRLGRLLTPASPGGLFQSEAERRVLAELFKIGLISEPEVILRMAAAGGPAIFSQPEASLEVVEQVLAATEGASEARILAARRAMALAASLSRYDRCEVWAGFVLAHTAPSEQTHCAVLAGWGFALFENGRSAEAVEALTKAAELAAAHGWPAEEASARGNLASVRLHMLELDGVMETYLAALEQLRPTEGLPGSSAIALNIGLCHLMMGDAEECRRWARRAAETAPEASAGLWTAWARSLEALALAQVGELSSGLKALAEGLRLAYAAGSSRLIESAIDHAATLLICAGERRAGLWLRQALRVRREAAHRPHSPLELELMSRLGGLISPEEEEAARRENRLAQESLDLLTDFALQELDLAARRLA